VTTQQNIFLSEENIIFQKPLPGPSAQIFVIAQKNRTAQMLGAAAPSSPRLVRLCSQLIEKKRLERHKHCTLAVVRSMHVISSYRGNRPTNTRRPPPATVRTDNNTLRR